MAKVAAFDDPQKAIEYLIESHDMKPIDIARATGIDRATLWRARKGKVETSHWVRDRLKKYAERKRANAARSKMSRIAKKRGK